MTENEMIERGARWYRTHQKHVSGLMYGCTSPSVKPVGEDARRPELWKALHWKWFFEMRQDAHDRAQRKSS